MGRFAAWTRTIMKIHVTKEDIENGQQRDTEACPIALAIRRKLRRDDLCVDANGIFSNNDSIPWTPLPYKALVFIDVFDNSNSLKTETRVALKAFAPPKKRLKPFSFDIEFPKELR